MTQFTSIYKPAFQFTVRGSVQGVGYRYFAKSNAEKLGIIGFVKNQTDRSVLIIAQGDEGRLVEFERLLNKGPIVADVASVEKQLLSKEKSQEYNTFLSSGTFLVVK